MRPNLPPIFVQPAHPISKGSFAGTWKRGVYVIRTEWTTVLYGLHNDLSLNRNGSGNLSYDGRIQIDVITRT